MDVVDSGSYQGTKESLSLTNLQVAVGGQNVLNSTLNMTYENFLGTDFLVCGERFCAC
jgi:hypothetical protein